jgi:Ca2+-transporting ATPase
LLTNWVIIRYFLIGIYVGLATIGIFVYWYLYFDHPDGHTLISWTQLTSWNQCHKWTDFTVNSFSGFDLSKDPCNYFSFAKRKPCTLSLTVLVLIEMLNAMNAISDESSLLTMPVWLNPWLIVAICLSMSLHFVILYIPIMNEIFGIMPLDMSEWVLVLYFSVPVILLDEFMKIFVRMFRQRSQLDELTVKKLE